MVFIVNVHVCSQNMSPKKKFRRVDRTSKYAYMT